jgi:transcriptional regulator with XRE-family HTH domain
MNSFPNRVDEQVGFAIRWRRQSRDMSVKQIAALVGCTSERVEAYEAGRDRPPATTLLMIAKELGATIADLFDAFAAPVADSRPQVDWHALSQPINSGLGVLPGTRHRECYLYHPFVPIGRHGTQL